jgi:putative intracellular protease/amidase
MNVIIPLPDLDFDPTEVAVSWQILKAQGVNVAFATPGGGRAEADDIMITGTGLDLWSRVPGLGSIKLIGAALRANRLARKAYQHMLQDAAFLQPLTYAELCVDQFDGLLLPGGHRARGMRAYLESQQLQHLVGQFFASGKPVAAVCHGVVLAARSHLPGTSRSVLWGRKTTALPWGMERSAWLVTRVISRISDPNYYRTYREAKHEPPGLRSVQAEVTAALAQPSDFIEVTGGVWHWLAKSSGLFRDTSSRKWPAHVVQDGNYLSARWPGDVHTFALRFAQMLKDAQRGESRAGQRRE